MGSKKSKRRVREDKKRRELEKGPEAKIIGPFSN
jgi:hypothetical protein